MRPRSVVVCDKGVALDFMMSKSLAGRCQSGTTAGPRGSIESGVRARAGNGMADIPTSVRDCLVDTGAAMVLLPEDEVDKLGLLRGGRVIVTDADERKEEPAAAQAQMRRQTFIPCDQRGVGTLRFAQPGAAGQARVPPRVLPRDRRGACCDDRGLRTTPHRTTDWHH